MLFIIGREYLLFSDANTISCVNTFYSATYLMGSNTHKHISNHKQWHKWNINNHKTMEWSFSRKPHCWQYLPPKLTTKKSRITKNQEPSKTSRRQSLSSKHYQTRPTASLTRGSQQTLPIAQWHPLVWKKRINGPQTYPFIMKPNAFFFKAFQERPIVR